MSTEPPVRGGTSSAHFLLPQTTPPALPGLVGAFGTRAPARHNSNSEAVS